MQRDYQQEIENIIANIGIKETLYNIQSICDDNANYRRNECNDIICARIWEKVGDALSNLLKSIKE